MILGKILFLVNQNLDHASSETLSPLERRTATVGLIRGAGPPTRGPQPFRRLLASSRRSVPGSTRQYPAFLAQVLATMRYEPWVNVHQYLEYLVLGGWKLA